MRCRCRIRYSWPAAGRIGLDAYDSGRGLYRCAVHIQKCMLDVSVPRYSDMTAQTPKPPSRLDVL
eukprot:scaffold4501_cov108-Isochrysis_galbana.AAC.5